MYFCSVSYGIHIEIEYHVLKKLTFNRFNLYDTFSVDIKIHVNITINTFILIKKSFSRNVH